MSALDVGVGPVGLALTKAMKILNHGALQATSLATASGLSGNPGAVALNSDLKQLHAWLHEKVLELIRRLLSSQRSLQDLSYWVRSKGFWCAEPGSCLILGPHSRGQAS